MSQSAERQRLDKDEIQAHWAGVSEALARLLKLMDSREDWVVDEDSEFLDLLVQLIGQVERSEFAALIEKGENAGRLAEVLAMLCSSRFMRVMEMMDRHQGGMVSRISLALNRLGGDAEAFAKLFYERLIVIHRHELLSQIFSVVRSQRLADDLELVYVED